MSGPAAAAGGAANRSTFREALRLSWPATLALLLHAGYRVNDQFWVQGLGPSAQAALGVTSFMLILNFALVSLVHSGTLARVARASGAGDRTALGRAVSTGLRFGVVWFAVVGAAGWATSRLWVVALGAQGEVAELADEYLSVIYVCLPLIGMKPVVDGIFIALGNTVIPMLLSALSVALNAVLNPILIYGWGVVPELGVGGAAWATGIARGFSTLLGLLLLARYYRLHARVRSPVAWSEVRAIARIGWPVALSTASYAGVFVLVLKTSVEPFGREVQAGLGVAFNGIEAISYCALMGPAIAVSSMVGRRLGARDLPGAMASVRACLILSCAVALLFSLLFLFLPEELAGVYSDVAEVRAQAALYLWIVAWSQLATAAQSVLEQALAGAGRTFGMSLVNLFGNGLRIPLAYALAHPLGWGPAGIWWALNLSNVVKLAAIVAVFRRGPWPMPQDAPAGPSPPPSDRGQPPPPDRPA